MSSKERQTGTSSAHATNLQYTFSGFPPDRQLNCPECDYLLTGLPAAGACPECGLEYDAHTYVHIGNANDAEPGFFSVALGELFGYAFVVSIVLWFVDKWLFVAGILITIAILAVAMFLDWGKLTAPAVIIVGPNQMRYRRPSGPFQSARWADIEQLRLRTPWFGEKSLMIRQKDGTRHTLQFPGKDHDDIAQIIEAIRRRNPALKGPGN